MGVFSTGNVRLVDALNEASEYPFRPDAVKAIIGIVGQKCEKSLLPISVSILSELNFTYSESSKLCRMTTPSQGNGLCDPSRGSPEAWMYHQWQMELLPLIFSNLPNLGTNRDTTKKHKMNSVDMCSIYLLYRMLLCRISSRFQVNGIETYEREQYFCH